MDITRASCAKFISLIDPSFTEDSFERFDDRLVFTIALGPPGPTASTVRLDLERSLVEKWISTSSTMPADTAGLLFSQLGVYG